MNKERFLEEFRRRLSGLPQEDIEERVAFYSEMIDDRMEDGIPEEEAVAGIGPIDVIVEQIMSEIPLAKLVKEKVRPKRSLKAWELALLVLGSPVWIPIVIAALALLLSAYVVIWSVVVCIYAADLSLAAGAFTGVLGIAAFLREGSPAGAFFSLGTGMACAGLAILLFFVCVWITKEIIKLTGRMLLGLKASFIGKEA